MEFKVNYEIEIDAETPQEAALQVAEILKESQYAPYLTVTNPDNETIGIDLELETEKKIDTPKNKVIIAIKDDDICDIMEKPEGIEVEIRDYANPVGRSQAGENLQKDGDDGDLYYIKNFGEETSKNPLSDDVEMKFENFYKHFYKHCGAEWDVEWDSMCNDKCPKCDKEIEPYKSEEIE